MPYGFKWKYNYGNELNRGINEEIMESELQDSLNRINSEITQQPQLAVEVIYKPRAILISVNHIGLIRANETFFPFHVKERINKLAMVLRANECGPVPFKKCYQFRSDVNSLVIELAMSKRLENTD